MSSPEPPRRRHRVSTRPTEEQASTEPAVPTDLADVAAEEPAGLPLLEPADGTPDPVDDAAGLAAAGQALAAGHGPVAVDAERASGFRYGQRAYLVQLRRAGAGTWLIDPVGCPDLTSLDVVLAETEWVLHAASQDLPCLQELGMVPRRLFDTELAGRLAGFERVGLGAMVDKVLGRTLEKGHSAADWSTRPLPREWLTYAALDVELLVELRDALSADLEAQGKLGWAEQEFAAIAAAGPPPPRADPWQRTSGIHRVRSARGLAMVRSLWQTRDQMARGRDLAPGRVLPDAAIISAVRENPQTVEELLRLPVFGGRATRRHADTWFGALEAGRKEREMPRAARGDGPPPANRWAERDPAAADRLARVRAALAEIGERWNVPVENLLLPDSVRRLAWRPPQPTTEQTVTDFLRSTGARSWQVELTAGALSEAVTDPLAGDAAPSDD